MEMAAHALSKPALLACKSGGTELLASHTMRLE